MAIITEYIHPQIIMQIAVRLSSLRLRKTALLMANHRSIVMIVRVNIDKCAANTVRKPAVLHPMPENNQNKGKFQTFFRANHSPYCQSNA